MRILMTIADRPECLPNSYLRELQSAGVDVHGLQLSSTPGTPIWRLTHRIAMRIAPERAFDHANRQLLEAIQALRPAVVWVFKGMEIYPATLQTLRRAGIFLVNYNADHPFMHFAPGTGNANVIRSFPLYDMHFTYSRRIAAEIQARSPGARVAVLPFAHAVDDAVYAQICDEDEINRACFVGNPDKHRRESVRALVRAGVPVDVYGHDWEEHLAGESLLRLHPASVGADYCRTLRRYRVQLNFLRPHNIDSHNMRTFEVPAVGGIMLAQDTIEHREFFEPSREAFFFGSEAEMISKAKDILSLSPADAAEIRRAARLRSVGGGYSYPTRAAEALKQISSDFEAAFATKRGSTSVESCLSETTGQRRHAGSPHSGTQSVGQC